MNMAVVAADVMPTARPMAMRLRDVAFDDVHAFDARDGRWMTAEEDELAQRRKVLRGDATEFGFEGVFEFAAGLGGPCGQGNSDEAGRDDQTSARSPTGTGGSVCGLGRASISFLRRHRCLLLRPRVPTVGFRAALRIHRFRRDWKRSHSLSWRAAGYYEALRRGLKSVACRVGRA
jgi:hypothetical protein